MILFGREDLLILWLLLLAAMGLTFVETRQLRLDVRMTLWWVLLVALTHVIGYLALRIWAARTRREDAGAG